MKIKVIGSGAIIVPEASASALIDDRILVDLGAGVFKQLIRLGCDLAKIDTVLITHLHSDHFMDVPFMMMAKGGRQATQKTRFYLPEGGIKAVHEIAKYLWNPDAAEEVWWPENIELIEYVPDGEFEAAGAKVMPIKVQHGGLKACGFIVDKDGRKVGFSGDSVMCEGVERVVQGADLSFLDASCPEEGNTVHMGLNDIYRLCEKYPEKKIVTTHMYGGIRQRVRRDVPNLLVPEDGVEYEI